MPLRASGILAVAVLTLAACSGRQATQGFAGSELDQLGISPLFAPLFVEGQVFRYIGHSRASHWDDADAGADEFGTMNTESRWGFDCTVDEVEDFATAMVAEIQCDDQDQDLIAGFYAADAAGLWRLSDLPDSEAELVAFREQLPILATPPSPRSDTTEDEWGGSSIDVEGFDDGSWCVTESYWGGDESTAALCFEEGRGITTAEQSFSGGYVQETSLWLEE